jgi:hypothetical protein
MPLDAQISQVLERYHLWGTPHVLRQVAGTEGYGAERLGRSHGKEQRPGTAGGARRAASCCRLLRFVTKSGNEGRRQSSISNYADV